MKNYEVIKDKGRFTIGEFDPSYNAYIINDGICNYYWWGTKEEAQEAAEAYNEYEGEEWLGEHGNGNDVIYEDEIEDVSEEMLELYKLFGAVKSE